MICDYLNEAILKYLYHVIWVSKLQLQLNTIVPEITLDFLYYKKCSLKISYYSLDKYAY